MRLIGFIVILALITLTVGYFSGWVSFASETENGSTAFRIRIDRTELKEDMKSLESATRKAVKSVDHAASAAAEKLGEKDHVTTNARVVSVSPSEGTMTLAYENGEQRVLPIALDDRTLAGDLKAGDSVVVRSLDGQVIDVHRP